MAFSYLIKDTTKEQRQELVKDAVALSTLDAQPPTERGNNFLKKYIEGEMELNDIVDAILSPYKQNHA